MRKLFTYIVISSVFSSCVTMFGSSHKNVRVNVHGGTQVICKESNTNFTVPTDSYSPTEWAEVRLYLKRGNKPVSITIKNDSAERTIILRPQRSFLYYNNIYPLCGLGFIFDYKRPDSYTYPSRIYPASTACGFSRFKPVPRRYWQLMIAPPLTNVFVFNLNNLNSSGGPIGINLGLNYHYSSKNYISAEAGIAIVTPMHFGDRFYDSSERFEPYEKQRKSGMFFSIQHHHNLGRFDVGYGASASHASGDKYYVATGFGSREDSVVYTASTLSIGGALSVNYRLGKSVYAGMQYLPQVWESGSASRFNYQHLLLFGLSWRLNFCTQH